MSDEKLIKCYSTDDENFNFDSFGDLIDSMDGPEIGSTYYEADCVKLLPTEPITNYTVGYLLEEFDAHVYDEIGEVYDNECSSVSDDAKQELRYLLDEWAKKHIDLGRYWKIIGKTRQMKITQEDLS